jgi:hypothetical protein
MQRRGEYERIRLALSRSAHFGSLAPATIDRLAEIGSLRHARHAERLGRADTVDENLWIVVSGAVRISTRPHAGRRECVHAVLGDGSYFGLANAVGHGPFTFDARAFGASDVAVIDGKRLAPVLDQTRASGGTSRGSCRSASSSRSASWRTTACCRSPSASRDGCSATRRAASTPTARSRRCA